MIALGEKRSELPFSNEDRRLLTTVAASGALALESRFSRMTPSHDGGDSPAGMPVDASLPEVVDLGMSLVDVLDRIHTAGILHRDIKPSNIGFTNRGKLEAIL